jgi:capsule polysaccharide export protein KpsE/RkpR
LTALTKLFVVLNVICSLLLSASVVVFVNRVEDFKAQAETNLAAKQAAERMFAQATSAREKSELDARDQSSKFSLERTDLQGRIATLQGDVAKLNADLTQKTTDLALVQSQISSLTDAAKALEAANKMYQADLADERIKNTDLNGKTKDLNTTITDLTATRETLEATRRTQSEQLKQAEVEITRLKNALAEAHINPDASASAEVPNVPVVGTVKAVEIIAGIHYATISVGSSDSVTKNMKFYAVNHNTGEFLGILTVSNVTPTEAVGRLDGPKVEKIMPGVQVKTQL